MITFLLILIVLILLLGPDGVVGLAVGVIHLAWLLLMGALVLAILIGTSVWIWQEVIT